MVVDKLLVVLAVAGPYHIIVDGLPTTQADPWIMLGTIASIGVALFTGVLALQTKRLADRTATLSSETKKMAQQTAALAAETQQSIAVARAESAAQDRHHQESLSPVIVLTKPTVRLDVRMNQNGPQGTPGYAYNFTVRAEEIKNIGFGPAFNISLELRVSRTLLTGCISIPSLGIGSRAPEIHELSIWVADAYGLQTNDFVDAIVLLTYENVFGQQRVTTYELAATSVRGTPTVKVVSERTDQQRIATRTSADTAPQN
jgi:hypothetical protein